MPIHSDKNIVANIIKNQMKKILSLKHLLLVAILIGISISCIAQKKSNEYSKTIIEQGEMLGQYLVKKDYHSFCKYTYPKIIELMQGKENMIAKIKNELDKTQSEGTELISVKIGEPSKIITIGNEMQCTVPQTIEMKTPNGRIKMGSTLIAISNDKGKNWYFVDTTGKDIKALKKILPNLSGDLKIPKMTNPEFIEE